MKKIYFWFLAIVIVAGYFGLCYFISPHVSLSPDDFSPFVFGVVNLVEILIIFAFLLFFMFCVTEEEDRSLIQFSIEGKELFLLIIFLLLGHLPLTLWLFTVFGYARVFDFTLLVFLPSNFLFVYVGYKMFGQWGKIPKAMVIQKLPPPASVNKKVIIDTSVPLLPILWMGDKHHPLYTYIKKEYVNVLVWDDIRSNDTYNNLTRIKTKGILIISYPIVDQKKIISTATEEGIAIIVVVKKKNSHHVAKVYSPHCIICQTDNRADYGCSQLSRLIEQHGKRST
ncbi:MAG: hypothetical protein WCL18_00525 [bacterium]